MLEILKNQIAQASRDVIAAQKNLSDINAEIQRLNSLSKKLETSFNKFNSADSNVVESVIITKETFEVVLKPFYIKSGSVFLLIPQLRLSLGSTGTEIRIFQQEGTFTSRVLELHDLKWQVEKEAADEPELYINILKEKKLVHPHSFATDDGSFCFGSALPEVLKNLDITEAYFERIIYILKTANNPQDLNGCLGMNMFVQDTEENIKEVFDDLNSSNFNINDYK